MLMNQNEKCELLKKSIEQLYSKEGRSKVYISNLLGLNRKVLGLKINEWKLKEPKTKNYLKPTAAPTVFSPRPGPLTTASPSRKRRRSS